MTKVMILGAARNQLPLIKKAKEMGLYVVVVSIPGNYPGFEFADKIHYESVDDKEKILQIAENEEIEAICSTGLEIVQESIGYVCDRMGLPGITEEAARLATNKFLMKKAFIEYGVRTSKFFEIGSADEALACFEKLEKPVIMKVVDSSGSRGIVKIGTKEEVVPTFEHLYSLTKEEHLILEEYIEGEEFGAQAALANGKLTFVMPHGDLLYFHETNVPIGHYVPYELDSEIENDLYEQLNRSIQALKLDNCAVNADFILKDGKIYVLEVAGRAGATNLPDLTSFHYGRDMYEHILEIALGRATEFAPKKKVPCASEFLFSEKAGVLQNCGLTEDPDILMLECYVKPGEKVRKFRTGADILGTLIVRSDEKEGSTGVLKKLKEIKNRIAIDVA